MWHPGHQIQLKETASRFILSYADFQGPSHASPSAHGAQTYGDSGSYSRHENS